MAKYPQELVKLITYLRKLPGVGARTAERFAFDLLGWKNEERQALAKILHGLEKSITYCSSCGCIEDRKICHYCDIDRRDPTTLCLLSSPKEVFTIEQTGSYRGLYHVLGPLLSPLDGISHEHYDLNHLLSRIKENQVEEIILAFDSTLEGDATSLYLHDFLKTHVSKISKLALGMPMGSSLDFVDESTLSFAFKGRQRF